jgi:choline dehydrogenase-like flavoprotein
MVAELAAVDSDSAVDVVVVGSGGAGCVAALAASTDGAEVLVLEEIPGYRWDDRYLRGRYLDTEPPEGDRRGRRDRP